MRTLTAFVLLGLFVAPSAASAQSSDFDIPAHVSRVDGRAVIERAEGSEDLERNLTLMEGDRIRTFAGRVEILFADGTLLHLDRHTVLDFQTDQFVRVMEGRARWIVSRNARGAVRVDTPAATLELDPGGDYRVAVAPNGDAELAVRRGSGALFNDRGDTELRAGERAVAATGRAPSQPFYANAASWDDFDRWSDSHYRTHMSAASVRYLPNELHPYGSVFDNYGSWDVHPAHGYVWYPVVSVGWQPYYHGRWHSYPRYGWTWIGRDAWAWPTHHFGRWGFSAGVWFWIPGRTWGPAWVAWASTRAGYVGWSPLGYDDHPIYRLNVYSPYSAGYPWCGWTFIRDRHFGGYVPSQGVIGVGVNVIAQSGITPVVSSPVPSRAIPRHGVPSGTAVPRGRALAQPGGVGSPGGLAAVPTARPRQIPTDVIRARGGSSSGDNRQPVSRTPEYTGTARPRDAERQPRDSAEAPRDLAPPSRDGSRQPRASSTPAGTARPRDGGAVGGSLETPASSAPPSGRPIRRARDRDAGDASGMPYPYSSAVPRTRERTPDAAAPSAGRPSWRAPERSESVREARPRETERTHDAPPAAQPRSRSEGPAWRAPSGREPQPSAPSAPSARPQRPPAGGGGQPRASGADRGPSPAGRRAPSTSSSSAGRQAQRRAGGGVGR